MRIRLLILHLVFPSVLFSQVLSFPVETSMISVDSIQDLMVSPDKVNTNGEIIEVDTSSMTNVT